MSTVRLARHAMASRFELVLHGQDAARLRAAGEEALDEVDRIEAQLSLYRPTSEIAHLNARAACEPVRLSPTVFSLLLKAREISAATDGAFDVTVAPLANAWGFMHGTPKKPAPHELARILETVGFHNIEMDQSSFEVRFRRKGVMIDLGAIGKGFAVDQAVALLKESGVGSALLHGGTSTVYGLGAPPGQEAWKIGIETPGCPGSPADEVTAEDAEARVLQRLPSAALGPPERGRQFGNLIEVQLRDLALSVSSPGGKFFSVDGKRYGHVIDPRRGEPTRSAALAAIALASATESDALSTALLVLGPGGVERLGKLRPEARLWLL